ncbi:MAG: ATP synthase F0 subunit C [bacterium]|nr:ATP synthase F0 subunit C [bacterium]
MFLLGAEETIAKTAINANFFIWSIIIAGGALALAAAVCGIAQSLAARKALEGSSRQPEAAGALQTQLILALAFIESLVIYVLVIAFILIFANPFVKYFIK